MIALGARKTIALELHVPIIDGAAAVYMKMRSNQINVSRVCSIVPSIHLLLVLMLGLHDLPQLSHHAIRVHKLHSLSFLSLNGR